MSNNYSLRLEILNAKLTKRITAEPPQFAQHPIVVAAQKLMIPHFGIPVSEYPQIEAKVKEHLQGLEEAVATLQTEDRDWNYYKLIFDKHCRGYLKAVEELCEKARYATKLKITEDLSESLMVVRRMAKTWDRF